jgi:hypothetical protein
MPRERRKQRPLPRDALSLHAAVLFLEAVFTTPGGKLYSLGKGRAICALTCNCSDTAVPRAATFIRSPTVFLATNLLHEFTAVELPHGSSNDPLQARLALCPRSPAQHPSLHSFAYRSSVLSCPASPATRARCEERCKEEGTARRRGACTVEPEVEAPPSWLEHTTVGPVRQRWHLTVTGAFLTFYPCASYTYDNIPPPPPLSRMTSHRPLGTTTHRLTRTNPRGARGPKGAGGRGSDGSLLCCCRPFSSSSRSRSSSIR